MKLIHYDTYICMFDLLCNYWDQTKQDDLGALLGTLNPDLLTDGTIIDSQLELDWNALFENKDVITEVESYMLVIKFLEKQLNWLDLKIIVLDLKKSFENQNDYWVIWMRLFEQKPE